MVFHRRVKQIRRVYRHRMLNDNNVHHVNVVELWLIICAMNVDHHQRRCH